MKKTRTRQLRETQSIKHNYVELKKDKKETYLKVTIKETPITESIL